MNSNLKISLIQDTAAFRSLREEWHRLLDDCDSKNIFLTWEWLYTWWVVYCLSNKKYQLSLIELRDMDGQLVGIGPFKTKMTIFSSRSEFLGNGSDISTEYLDLIIRRGYETTVRECVANLLNELAGVDVITLKPLLRESIQDWNELRWPYKKNLKFSKCPIINLSTSWEGFLERQSKNFKKKSKEYYRVCRRDLKLKFIRVDSDKELDGRMKDLARLHHLRWNGKSASFISVGYLEFHGDIARKFLANGWLRFFFLLDGEKPIAAIYCFSYNGVYYYYQSGRDPAYAKYHVGSVLLNLAIQEAINEGARVFDMLTGEEAYKHRWADMDNICYHFIAFKNRRAYLRHQLECVLGRLSYFQDHWGYVRKQSKTFAKKQP
jgi:hypothetical protein